MAIKDYDADGPVTDIPSVSASVQNTGQTALSTIAATVPKGYYVIVGCGPAAMINHTTLRQGSAAAARLKLNSTDTTELPVVHVGHEDPWRHYFKHGMGQPPYLLRMPGYHSPIGDSPEVIDHRLSSGEFATSTAGEWSSLQTLIGDSFRKKIYAFEGWVAAVQSRGTEFHADQKKNLKKLAKDLGAAPTSASATMFDEAFTAAYASTSPPYRLLVVDPAAALWWVYAHRIDICTGSGINRVIPRDCSKDAEAVFSHARKAPWIPFGQFARRGLDQSPVVHGRDGLVTDTVWNRETRVCVFGAGGIALNQVERCKTGTDEQTCLLDWLAPKTLAPNFNLPTNDPVLRVQPLAWADEDRFMLAGGANAVRGRGAATFLYVPGSLRWRFAIGTGIKGGIVARDSVTALLEQVTEKSVISVAAKMWDAFPAYDSKTSTFDTSKYPLEIQLAGDMYPYSAGYSGRHTRVTGKFAANVYSRLITCFGLEQKDNGEPFEIIKGISFEAIKFKDRCVGWKSKGNGDIRILGAAALVLPLGVGEIDEDTKTKTQRYNWTLPLSAVPCGFIRAGCTIASANGYFDADGRHNANINTASEEELIDALTKGGVSGDAASLIARTVIFVRMPPANGISSLDQFKRRCTEIDTEMKKDVDKFLAGLSEEHSKALALFSKSDYTDATAQAWNAATKKFLGSMNTTEVLGNWDKVEKALKMDYPAPLDWAKVYPPTRTS